MSVPIEKFGKDHWSLLAYLETRVIDHGVAPNVGEVDKKHMRCNASTHPVHYAIPHKSSWETAYGTRLKGFHLAKDKEQESLRLPDHDDWDCLDDLEDAGLVKVMSEINGFVLMTPEGQNVAAQIRKHKAAGGNFATFEMKD